MKKLVFASLFFIGLVFSNNISAQNSTDQDLQFKIEKDTLTITILDKTIKTGEILIYKTFGDEKINTDFFNNPIKIYIGDWEKSWYHIKLDYGLVSQFRHLFI
ncbi:MAG: hypothetical protein WCK02_05175 [Bacteroidota bacterium]